jgi:hypothetical protein
MGECEQIAFSHAALQMGDDIYLTGSPAFNVVDPDIEDNLVFFLDASTGSFDLAMAPDDNFGTCDHCLLLLADDQTVQFFQSQGTLDVNTDPTTGTLDIALTGVRLVEITIDDMGASVPVEGGGCIDIVDGTVDNVTPEPWNCASDYFGAGDGCDCGCGATDIDCEDMSLAVCDFCDDNGSCSMDACDAMPPIDDMDNAVCV